MFIRKFKILLLPGVLVAQTFVPTGKTVTPDAAPGSTFQMLDAQVTTSAIVRVGQAMSTTLSPDGNTLLILTSGYNYFAGADGQSVSGEYVFVFDVSAPQRTAAPYPRGHRKPSQARQVLQVTSACSGIAWNPNGSEFYVAGGDSDNVLIFDRQDSGAWFQSAAVRLGHKAGLGSGNYAMAAGLAVNAQGTFLAVANLENDSISILDIGSRAVRFEVDLRPGIANPACPAVPAENFLFGL